MPKKFAETSRRFHFFISERDLERIERIFYSSGKPGEVRRNKSEIIRLIITKFLDHVEAQAQQTSPVIPPLTVDDII
jgi:hypothetical protein